MADIVGALLDVRQDGGNATFHLTNIYTPAANRLNVLVTYALQILTTPPPPIPAVTGNGVTWILMRSQLFDHAGTDQARVSVYRAVSAVPTSGQTRVEYGGGNDQHRFATTVYNFTNVDITGGGANSIVQSNSEKQAQNVSNVMSVTLVNPGEDAANAILGVLGYGDTDTAKNPTVVAGAGFGILTDNPTVETGGQAMMFRNGVVQLVDWSLENSDYDTAQMGFELRNAVPAPLGPAPQILGRPAFIKGNLIT